MGGMIGAGDGAVSTSDAFFCIGPHQTKFVFVHGVGGAYLYACWIVAVVACQRNMVGVGVLGKLSVSTARPAAAFVVYYHAKRQIGAVLMVILASKDAGSASGAARVVEEKTT